MIYSLWRIVYKDGFSFIVLLKNISEERISLNILEKSGGDKQKYEYKIKPVRNNLRIKYITLCVVIQRIEAYDFHLHILTVRCFFSFLVFSFVRKVILYPAYVCVISIPIKYLAFDSSCSHLSLFHHLAFINKSVHRRRNDFILW